MRNRIAKCKEKLMRDDRFFLILMSLAFFLLMCLVHIGGDDSGSMRYENGTLLNYLQKTAEFFYIWSSRIFVNTAIFIFTDNRKLLWAVCMGVTMYMMLRAFYVLSDAAKGNHRMKCLFIIAMFMLFPFKNVSTAGWIATTTTYFMTAAAGFYSLIPIKKTLNGEKYSCWEYAVYPASLLFGANNEQMMLVVLAAYSAAFLYSVLHKKIRPFWIVQFLLAMGSGALVLLCPGNWERKANEAISNFPTWGMYNRIDQFDFGYSVTMRWLLFASNAFIIALCVLLAYIIWKKHTSTFLRMIAAAPVLCTVLFGPFKSVTTLIFPYVEDLSVAIKYQGLVTVENRGGFHAFTLYAIWAVLIMIIAVEVILASENLWTIIASFILLGSGIASRIAIGFSPTVYVSGMRTCAVMSFCVIASACLIFSGSVEKGVIEGKALEVSGWICRFTLLCGCINTVLLVGGTIW